ncbi:hypothetical protein IMG5_137130 [Ichthyophthirius multifiliis]|uniref:Tetratricopeptide repeat protein n=1 Tax=Ichthyophthirius multifiliis TaxID=5932 RepID=G0QX15_ICHMU|nr:hypothetical protein IMG5_137130 [Ichthyophthirius multifiliis]EGR30238.1 hypothetical protein IMG5_137130 [Ichthyophthirius multifiliis]|eukprot:XP_004031834.1 hypothetical protein IMG5_137130 [Ichthyophthirius multifiliis]
MDNFIIAMSRYKRRKYDQAIELSDQMIELNQRDQAAWIIKCNCLIKKNYIDDLETDEEGIGDILLDENTVSQYARPGTSLQRPTTSSQNGLNPIQRPVSKSGRPITGFARPGTNRLQSSSNQNRIETALQGNRIGTTRPITSGGRYMRLGTACLIADKDNFLQIDKLDMKKIAKKGILAQAICNYLLYVENNPKKALQLASECTQLSQFKDWWWKERLAKCYSQLGLHREAEKQLQSSLKDQDIIKTHLQLAKVYIRLNQPITAIECYKKGLQKHPQEIQFILGIARIYDQLVLSLDSSNMESVAQLAANQFYIDQPEVSTKFYQRLLQLGINQAELWNNLALCLFYDGQYDLFYSCFEKALMLADESNKADIWYNISHVFINLGETGMAYQCLKIAICFDPHHPEAYNNLGILEIKKGNIEKGKYELQVAMKEGEMLIEPHYNAALWAFNTAEYQEALNLVNKAICIYPDHDDSKKLKKNIEDLLKVL